MPNIPCDAVPLGLTADDNVVEKTGGPMPDLPDDALPHWELAKKYNLDPQRWDGNVEKAILMKMNPKYYNDPVTRYGYCRGTETVAYVKRITDFYEHARREISA